jgi:hypothetical protein
MVSNLVYSLPPACATPPPRDTVYEPDPRLGFGNRQVDGFNCAGGRTSWCICEVVVVY